MQNLRQIKTVGWSKEFRRFLKYLLVGLSGTVLDFAILAALKNSFHLPTLNANIISYSCGIINNFLLSRYWIWRGSGRDQAFSQFIKFILVGLVGLALNNLIVLGIEGPAGRVLHNAGLGYIPAKIIATGAGLFWNYLANRRWTFGAIK